MPRLDLYCPTCGAERPNTFLPLITLPEPRVAHGYVVTQDVIRPTCCGQPMDFHPPSVAMDALEPMHEFTTQVQQPDGSYKDVVIDSLAKIRQLEHESEIRQRNGEGQQMIWRDYSQDRSNRDVHTMGTGPALEITPEIRRKFKPLSECVSDGNESYGPGVSDANTSPLAQD